MRLLRVEDIEDGDLPDGKGRDVLHGADPVRHARTATMVPVPPLPKGTGAVLPQLVRVVPGSHGK